MKKILLLTLLLTSCGTIDQYNSLPPEKRSEFLKAETVSFLRDNRDVFKKALVFAGIEVMDGAIDDQERKAVSDQMWAVSKAFTSIATGRVVSGSQVTDAVRSFSPGFQGASWIKYVNQVGLIWSSVFDKLKLSDSQELAVSYLLAFSEAAQEVAGSYQSAVVIEPSANGSVNVVFLEDR